jgi:broad specificity phosphatase PhoE
MTTIYLVRHGQASFGAESYDQLSKKGELQAQILGQYLKKLMLEQPYVVAGSMKRHLQTARISLDQSFKDTEIHIDSNLNEFNHQQIFEKYQPRFSDPALLKQDVNKVKDPRAYLGQIFEGAIKRWTSNEFHQDYDESWPEFKDRVINGFDHLCEKLKTEQPRYAVVYTSGGVISVIIGHLLGLSPEKTFALNWSITNTSFTTLRLVGAEPQLLSLNEHHYLKEQDRDLLTWI